MFYPVCNHFYGFCFTKENVSAFQSIIKIICYVYNDDMGEEGEDNIDVYRL